MLTVVPVVSPIKSVSICSSVQKGIGSLQRVRSSVMQHAAPRKTVSLRLFVLHALLAGILLTIIHCSILQVATATQSITKLWYGAEFSFSLQPTATTSQQQMLIQALFSLPQTEFVNYRTREDLLLTAQRKHPVAMESVPENRNPFLPGIDVTLRSLEDFSSFFAFLQRSELQSVLAAPFLWDIPEQYEAILLQIQQQVSRRSAAYFLGIGSILCFSLVLLIFVLKRIEERSQEFQLFTLFGAGVGMQRMALLREVFLFFGGALLLSLLLTLPCVIILGAVRN